MVDTVAGEHEHGPAYEAGMWISEHGPDLVSAAQDPALWAGASAIGLSSTALGLAGVSISSAGFQAMRAATIGNPVDTLMGYRREWPVDPLLSWPVYSTWIDRLLHMQAVGPTGSAKTSLLRSLAIQDLWARRKVVVLEIYGDLGLGLIPYAKAIGLPVWLCDASQPQHRSLRWNPLAGDDTERIAERLAAAFRGMSDHDYWAPVSANIVRHLVALARTYARSVGREADLGLLDLLATDLGFFRQAVKARKDQDSGWRATAPFLDHRLQSWVEEYLAWSEATRRQNMSGVVNRIQELLSTSAARRILCPRGNDRLLDLEALNSGVGGLTILRFPIDIMGSGAARTAAGLALRDLQATTLGRPLDGAPPLVPYLDEFPTLVGRDPGTIDETADWLTLVRKHNVAVTVAYQGRALLPEVLRGALESNGRNLLVAGGLGADDAGWAQRMLGREMRVVEDERRTKGANGRIQVSTGRREEERPRQSEEEIRGLPRGQWIAMLMRHGNQQRPIKVSAPKALSPSLYRSPKRRRRTR